jgi:sugar phosphate permease
MTKAKTAPGPGYRYYVLAILIVVYTFNFLDRQILGILAGSIKKELGLTDSQLGLMAGPAFALLYTGLGVPVAWLADRGSRTWIMTAALTIWSGFTALCGFATGFWTLFLSRVGVGVGEAGGTAPAYSLIGDYFPPEQRARALAAYSFGIPIGGALGTLFGGLIAATIDWRVAFIVVGLCGVALAPIFRLTVRDPRRGGDFAPKAVEAGAGDLPAPVPQAAPAIGLVLKTLLAKPSFWLLSLGASSASLCGYGIAFWLPSFLERSLGLSLTHRALFLGVITLVGGVAGVWGGGWLADKLAGANKRSYPLIPAVAFVIALPCFFLGVFTLGSGAGNLWLAFFLFIIPTGLNLVWLGPVITSIQHLVPGHMRSTASAAFLFVNNLIGLGLGTYYFGLASDLLAPHFGADSLKYAIYSGLTFYLIAAGLFVLASQTLTKDWVD